MTSNSRCEVQTMDDLSCLAFENQFEPESEIAAVNDGNGSVALSAHLDENKRDDIETPTIQDKMDSDSAVGFHKDKPKRNHSTKNDMKAGKNVPSILTKCRYRKMCKESFESCDAMMLHLASYHARGIKKTFCCHLCKETFTEHKSIRRHMKSVHNDQLRFACPIQTCLKIFTRKDTLLRHTNQFHTKKIEFKCSKCPMKFHRRYYLIRHLARIHGDVITSSKN